MTHDELVDTIIDWVADTFGGLQVEDNAIDALIDRLETAGIEIEPDNG